LMELAHRHALKKVFLHFIADGQDMPAKDALHVLTTLEPVLKKTATRIASIQGRSFAMDRILNWKLTQRVWQAVVEGDVTVIENVRQYIEESYEKGITDYALEPATVIENGKPIGVVQNNDAIVFFDFRNDRVRQLAIPFTYPETFSDFEMIRRPKNLKVVTMTRYSDAFTVPIAYPALEIPQTLGEVVSRAGFSQWRIAEKEKEAHVTNFFNGGRIVPFEREQRCIVPSRFMRGNQYLVHPEMSAQKIVDALLERIDDDARLYIVNIANPDMIGHTGNLEATKRALGVTDACIGQVVERIATRTDTAILVTSDHGNAEELIDPLTGGEDTQHSTRSVPALFIVPHLRKENDTTDLEALAQEPVIGTLIDVAPTILELLGIDKPSEMTGSKLIVLE